MLLALIVPALFGIYIMRKMRFIGTWLEAFAFGIPVGIALFTALLFALYAIAGSMSLLLICLALAVFLLPVLADILSTMRQRRPASASTAKRRKSRKLKLFGLGLNLLLAIFLLCIIISSIFLFSVTRSGNAIYCIDAGCSDTL
ncbi:MAG: hypothetical protein QXW10_04225, partial [Candidatus Micrarchaeaceae archaeon]